MKGNFPITGTFIDEITYDIPSSNWSKQQWSDDLDYMAAVGIDTLIFIRGGFNGRMIYPSDKIQSTAVFDLLGFILDEAERRKMQVLVGLYISNLTWNEGDFKEELRLNKIFTEEVMQRYGEKPAFKGWYLPHEVGNNVYNITDLTHGLAAICKDRAPEKTILMSPFFLSEVNQQHPYSPQRTGEEWTNMFEKFGADIDYCAFQDGSAPLSKMDEYFKVTEQVCSSYGIESWANVETFERDVRFQYYPIPFDLLRAKINKSAPYVKKMITFEFSHFLSPQSIYVSARNLYNLYSDFYGKK